MNQERSKNYSLICKKCGSQGSHLERNKAMKRTYTAFCDNGHDYFSFEFESEHRANSKANKEDAYYAGKRRLGWSRRFDVKSTELVKY